MEKLVPGLEEGFGLFRRTRRRKCGFPENRISA